MVKGKSVAQGYWGKKELSEQVFQAKTAAGDGPYLRTGDLGFVLERQLYITSRLKDLIIIRGRNYAPQDIERTVQRQVQQFEKMQSVLSGIKTDSKQNWWCWLS